MLPRRCKKCSCYIAPQLSACPRCGKKSPAPVAAVKLTKEEKRAERKKLDAKVPVLHAKNIHWIPSAFSLRVQGDMLTELRRRIDKEESVRVRNAIRSELRLVKKHLARAEVPKGKHGWTTELLKTKIGTVSVFVSPKGHKYVLAERDDTPDLLIEPRKKVGLTPFRLQRLEKSKHARAAKKEAQEEKVHKKRHKEKKTHRAKKRLLKRKQS